MSMIVRFSPRAITVVEGLGAMMSVLTVVHRSNLIAVLALRRARRQNGPLCTRVVEGDYPAGLDGSAQDPDQSILQAVARPRPYRQTLRLGERLQVRLRSVQ